MSKPDIYEAIAELKTDIQILQIALSLLSQKLYPTFKIDKAFWDEVHQTHENLFGNKTEEVKDSEPV